MAYTREQRAAKAAAQAVAEPAAEMPQPAPAVRTVRMVRPPDTNPPPYSADVHPSEVDNWRAVGWRLV